MPNCLFKSSGTDVHNLQQLLGKKGWEICAISVTAKLWPWTKPGASKLCVFSRFRGHSHSAGNCWLHRTALWGKVTGLIDPILVKVSLSAGHDTDAHTCSRTTAPECWPASTKCCVYIASIYCFVPICCSDLTVFCNVANMRHKSSFWSDPHVPNNNTKDLMYACAEVHK